MGSKTINILLIVLILALFSSYFIVIHVVWDHHQVIEKLNQIQDDARSGDWDHAQDLSMKIMDDLNNHRFLILLNTGENEVALFDEALYHVNAEIKEKNVPKVSAYLAIAKTYWESLNEVVQK